MSEKILNILKKFDLKFKPFNDSNKNIQVNCPLCNDKRYRLGISLSDSHPWKCFNCNSKSKNLYTLEKLLVKGKTTKQPIVTEIKKYKKFNPELVDKCHEILLKEEHVEHLNYLINERKLSLETIKHFKLGLRFKFLNNEGEVYNAGPHIVIPQFENNDLVYIKYRNIDPLNKDKSRKWRREKDCKTVLFNNQVLNNFDVNDIFITESEIDAMSLYNNGIHNVVGITAGADTFSNQTEWLAQLSRFHRVFVVLDNDEAGQLGARKICSALGLGKCFNIVLPETVKDVNEYFLTNSKNDFLQLVKKEAYQFNPEDVISIRDAMSSYLLELQQNSALEEGIYTGFKSIDKVLGPMRPGNLIVLAAKSKVGKTNLVLNILKNMALYGKFNTFNYQCEMEPEDLVNAYCNMFMPYWKLPPLPTVKRDKSGELQFKSVFEKKQYEEAKNERIEIINHVRGVYPTDKLISYHPNSVNDLELETIVTKIRETVTRYDCKVVVFDNLLFACRGEKARELVDKFTQRFKLLARELNIVLICITHPKKTNHNKELENDDLKESSSIFQDADAVMLLHRPYLNEDNTNTDADDDEESQDIMSEIMGIKVTARRGKGGRTKVIFRGEFNSIIDDREELFRVMALEAKYK